MFSTLTVAAYAISLVLRLCLLVERKLKRAAGRVEFLRDGIGSARIQTFSEKIRHFQMTIRHFHELHQRTGEHGCKRARGSAQSALRMIHASLGTTKRRFSSYIHICIHTYIRNSTKMRTLQKSHLALQRQGTCKHCMDKHPCKLVGLTHLGR